MKRIDTETAQVHYLEAGSGEPVLMLHGYPESASSWRHQFGELSSHYRVIAPDWPGFGSSPPPATPPTYDAEVERIDELARALGLDRFNLVAHDYGGFLGLGYTLRHPSRVLRLALLNTRAHGIFRPSFYRFSLRQRWAASNAITAALARRLPIGAFHRRGLRRYRELGCWGAAEEREYLGWMDEPSGRRWYTEFFSRYHVPVVRELADGLERIRCPTAIIWGERDPYVPFETARELVERIPGATLTRFSDGDHFIMEERPGEVTRALLELLARGIAERPGYVAAAS